MLMPVIKRAASMRLKSGSRPSNAVPLLQTPRARARDFLRGRRSAKKVRAKSMKATPSIPAEEIRLAAAGGSPSPLPIAGIIGCRQLSAAKAVTPTQKMARAVFLSGLRLLVPILLLLSQY